jgi:hypothetical protein
MRKRFNGIENNTLLGSTTILDPIFKKLAISDNTAIDIIVRLIKHDVATTCERSVMEEQLEQVQTTNL